MYGSSVNSISSKRRILPLLTTSHVTLSSTLLDVVGK